MSENVKIIERPYKVYAGKVQYWRKSSAPWELFPEENILFQRAFWLESDAEVFAERLSEDYEFVRIEKKENN